MTKFIEQMKMKKLAKKIAGVTLGAVALGAMSMSPVYAEKELHGGEGSDLYTGSEENYAVEIYESATNPGNVTLSSDMGIAGFYNVITEENQKVTGSVTARDLDSSLVTGIRIWGSFVESSGKALGIKGINNNVIWNASAKVGSITTITGFQGNGEGKGISAEKTLVQVESTEVTGVQYPSAISGTRLEGENGEATATDTTVILSNVAAKGNVYGDDISSVTLAKATGTKVEIRDKTVVEGDVYGAYLTRGNIQQQDVQGEKAEASGVTVTLIDSQIKNAPATDSDPGHRFAYGVAVKNIKTSTIENTNVNVTDSTIGTMMLYGVYQINNDGVPLAEKLTTNNTTITLNGATVNGMVEGVESENINEIEAKGTKITFQEKPSNASGVYGVQLIAKKKATAENTEVDIKVAGSKIVSVVGAHIVASDADSEFGKATGTKVTLNGVESVLVSGDGISADKDASSSNAKVDVTGGKIASRIYGADLNARGKEGKATAAQTTVTLQNITGTTTRAVGAVVSAQKKATADTTTVEVTGGTFGTVGGAQVTADGTEGEAVAKNTKVTLKSVTAGNEATDMAGGLVISGTKSVDVDNTELNITGGKINNGIFAGVLVQNSSSKEMKVNDTRITLNGVASEKDLYGVAYTSLSRIANPTVINATNTQIVFEGEKSTIKGTVYGIGAVSADPGADFDSSNTSLTINNLGNEVGNIANFEEIYFVLPNGVKNDDVMLKITGTETTELKDTGITTTSAVKDRGDLKAGDKIYLIKAENGKLNFEGGEDPAPSGDVFIVKDAVSTLNGTYNKDTKNLWLDVTDNRPTPPGPVPPGPVPPDPSKDIADNQKSMAETLAASMAFLNRSHDFINDQMLGDAITAAKEDQEESKRYMMPFASFGGSSLKYKSGSHIDAKGWNGAVGFAKAQGDLTFGFAVEHGQADFDSYVNEAHGEGKNKYTGGVIFAEVRKKSGAHFDASFRAGRAESDYNANLHVLGIATPTSYDISGTYLGFSVGGGKEMKVGDKGTLDLYGRYYFNHLSGNNTKTNDGIDVEFKDSDSSRLRLGTRFTQQMSDRNKLYAGLAWQYEFSGKARAVINGFDAPAPTLKGHSAMLELGLKTRVGKNLNIDFGLNGWVGKQRGIAGNLGFKWVF